MDGVIIEYKGTNRMRIVGSAQERYHISKAIHRVYVRDTMEALGSSHQSPMTGGPNPHWGGHGCLDIHCWKRNKKARKNWMRHPKRTKCRHKNRWGHNVSYYPSIHNLANNVI